jgi:hypothetical protein
MIGVKIRIAKYGAFTQDEVEEAIKQYTKREGDAGDIATN